MYFCISFLFAITPTSPHTGIFSSTTLKYAKINSIEEEFFPLGIKLQLKQFLRNAAIVGVFVETHVAFGRVGLRSLF